jgi:hypothetical protein
MEKGNLFVNLPTGFGKSLIFQCIPLCCWYLVLKTSLLKCDGSYFTAKCPSEWSRRVFRKSWLRVTTIQKSYNKLKMGLMYSYIVLLSPCCQLWLGGEFFTTSALGKS